SAQLQKMGVVMKRARYFITCYELASPTINELKPEGLRQLFSEQIKEKKKDKNYGQLSLW
ncbi:MAG TPA: radical SAM protein, partial [Bacteroidales bacterium]